MLTYRQLDYQDYYTLCRWWQDNRFPIVPRDFLPNDGLGGIIVEKDGVGLCAGFIYDTSAKALAWVEYIVANFEIKDREFRKKSQNFLIQSLLDICKKAGKKYVFSSIVNENLVKTMKENGFVIGKNNSTEVVKVI